MLKKVWEIGEPHFEAEQECPMYRSWPWNGHRRFAYDLIRFIKPERIVELGTYWGTSFFAFCQAVKDLKLSTECVAIDTWLGDDHTGSYDAEPYETFQQIKNHIFSSVNIRPLKMRFKEALSKVVDNSVDLLHIDGCHEYATVREDYQSWLPKLKKNGIVLFHDVADTVDYGSVRFWKEISSDFPHLTFQHSWGLGVLFPKDRMFYNQIYANNFSEKMKIYEYHSELDLALLQISDYEERAKKRNKFIDEQHRLMLKKDKILARKERQIEVEKRESDKQKKLVEKITAALETEKTRRTRVESSFLFRVSSAFNRAFNPK